MLGPTASGKSSLAMDLALRLEGEIVSVDSMQVYRGMDIGTAKPTSADRARVPHHLVDIVDPGEAYSVAEFQAAGRAALAEIAGRGRTAIICGGSGLHFRALVDPLEFPPTDQGVRAALEGETHTALVAELLEADSDSPDRLDLANPRRVLRAVEIYRLTGATPSARAGSPVAAAVREYRPAVEFVALGVDPGDRLNSFVERRLDAMLEAGWVREAHRLLPVLGKTAAAAVGYRELFEVAEAKATLDEGRREALRATLALAKRQRTFFRRDPRIRWLAWDDDPERRLLVAVSALEEAGAWTS